MKSRLITLAACLLVAGELSAATIKTTATETTEMATDTDVNAAATTPGATAQLAEEDPPALDKTLGKRGAIERRMSDAQERRRVSRETTSTSTTSGTVVPY